jgi:crotonobetainyl-CoA:carnitine CoA-transferase CaiB-like acyl-CoA transferase
MLVTAAALAGCNKENHTIVGGSEPDDNGTNATANAPVALPPSVVASKIYRCADNKIVYVDWLSDNKSANIRTDKTGTPTMVTAPEAGKPMTGAEGYSLDGTVSAKSVKMAVPGHASQTCNA